MYKKLSLVAGLLLSAQVAGAQANVLAQLGVRGITETGGGSQYHRYLPVLDASGRIGTGAMPAGFVSVSLSSVVYIDPVSGVDAASSIGSISLPYKTAAYAYSNYEYAETAGVVYYLLPGDHGDITFDVVAQPALAEIVLVGLPGTTVGNITYAATVGANANITLSGVTASTVRQANNRTLALTLLNNARVSTVIMDYTQDCTIEYDATSEYTEFSGAGTASDIRRLTPTLQDITDSGATTTAAIGVGAATEPGHAATLAQVPTAPEDIGAATSTQGANADTAHDLTTGAQPLDTATVIDRSVMVVAGFGTTAVNGIYVESGTHGGKPTYVFGDYRIYSLVGEDWSLDRENSPVEYSSPDDVATPDLATTWDVDESGELPIGTVTAGTRALTDISDYAADYAAQFQAVGVFDAATGRTSLELGTAATTDAPDIGAVLDMGDDADGRSIDELAALSLRHWGYTDTIVVSGAGTTAVNGEYTLTGESVNHGAGTGNLFYEKGIYGLAAQLQYVGSRWRLTNGNLVETGVEDIYTSWPTAWEDTSQPWPGWNTDGTETGAEPMPVVQFVDPPAALTVTARKIDTWDTAVVPQDLQSVTDAGNSTQTNLYMRAIQAGGGAKHSLGLGSIVYGVESKAAGQHAFAGGWFADAKDDYSYVWRGAVDSETHYESKGVGTWAINPEGGTSGAYIGDDSIADLLAAKASTNHVTQIASTTTLGHVRVDGTTVTIDGDGILIVAAAIVSGAADGATAEGWGDHATAGYLTTEADATALGAIAALTPASIGAATSTQGANADTAHDLTTGAQPLDTATVIDRSVMVVAGFGIAGLDQEYAQVGTQDGKPRYLGVTDSDWELSWLNAVGWYFSYDGAAPDVRSTEDAATPDLVTEWVDALGDPIVGATVDAATRLLADVADAATDYAAQFQAVGVFDAATGRTSLELGTAATTDATAYAEAAHTTTAATAAVLGHVKVGTNVDVAVDGTISVTIPGTPDLQAVTDEGASTTADVRVGSLRSGDGGHFGAQALGGGSLVFGAESDAPGDGAFAGGWAGQATHDFSFAWSGIFSFPVANYESKGDGTWAINPEGGTAGAFIGDDSIAELFLIAAAETDTKLGALEAELAAGRRIYYCVQSPTFTNTLSQVYGTMSTTPDADAYTVEIGPIDTTEFAQYSPGRGRITEAGLDVLSIPARTFEQSLYFDNSQGSNRAVALRVTATMVDADGESNPAVIATSSTGIIEALGAGVVQRVNLTFVVSPDFDTGGLDRRMLLDYEFKRTGSTIGTDPVVTRYAGGSSSGALSLQVPSTVVMLTSAANATSDALANLIAAAGGIDPTPYAGGTTSGAFAPDFSNGVTQRFSLNGAATLNPPTNPVDGARLELWITAATTTRDLSIGAAIKIPSDSAFTSPKALESGKAYIVLLRYGVSSGAWALTSLVGGF